MLRLSLSAFLSASIALIVGVASCDTPPAASPVVTREGFIAAGKVWPVTVENGEVGCTPNKIHRDADALWFRGPDNVVYGLNSYASVQNGYADLEPIWLEDEKANAEVEAAFPGQKLAEPRRLAIGDLAERAREICYSAPLS
ncbi:hypothetical protein GVN18_42160 [Pseudomonas sp. ODNR1LW]|nr:hypothetical protein [Pseudomonas sp. ODNR1LW]